MDPKLLLLFLFVVTVATEEECGSKKPAYFAMMFELTWKFNKERICDAIEVFNEKMENSTCFYPEEKLIFEALNESCDSNCNLYEVVKNGKYLAFRLSINAGTESACTCFPDMKNLLKEHECHALHEILQQLLNYCDEPVESQIDVSFNISSSKTN